jgi:hypothetical protein
MAIAANFAVMTSWIACVINDPSSLGATGNLANPINSVESPD